MLFLKGGNMAPIKREDRKMILLKTFILAVACLFLAGFLSCSGTNSTTSVGGGSGTGTEFRTTITVGEPVLPYGGATGVTAVVRDRTGTPVPFGTEVCFTAVINCFDPDDQKCYVTVCKSTSNNTGWASHTYVAWIARGEDTIQVYAPSVEGTINSTKITVE